MIIFLFFLHRQLCEVHFVSTLFFLLWKNNSHCSHSFLKKHYLNVLFNSYIIFHYMPVSSFYSFPGYLSWCSFFFITNIFLMNISVHKSFVAAWFLVIRVSTPCRWNGQNTASISHWKFWRWWKCSVSALSS